MRQYKKRRLREMTIPQLQKRLKVLRKRWEHLKKETREMTYIKWQLRQRKKT